MEIDIDNIQQIKDWIDRIKYNFTKATYQSHLVAAYELGELTEFVDTILRDVKRDECEDCE